MLTMIQRGFKSGLDALGLDPEQTITVEMAISGSGEYDYECFGLDNQEKCPDDRYFVFYGQEVSPSNEISLEKSAEGAVFQVNLASLPSHIQRLHFTVSIDGSGTMGEIRSCVIRILQNGVPACQLDMTGGDFQRQKALIGIELYQKNGWRVGAVANGFNGGGLSELLKHYGIEEIENKEEDTGGGGEEDTTPTPSPQSQPQPSGKEGIPSSQTGDRPRRTAPIEDPPPPPSGKPPSTRNAEGFERQPGDWV